MDPLKFVTDPDRREELARVTLRALSLTPAGETAAQAADRLSTVDSVRRHEVLLAAKAAEERAAAVRKAMEERASPRGRGPVQPGVTTCMWTIR